MLCRLCFYEIDGGDAVPLFSDGGESSQISKLIAKYLFIEVANNDCYSTNICRECFKNLNDFHNFFQNVELRQNLSQNAMPLNKIQAEEESKSAHNFDETPLDLKEFIPLEDSERLAPQIEFPYADVEDGNDMNEAHIDDDDENDGNDDEDDEPLKNLISREKIQKIIRNSRSYKPVGVKTAKSKRQKKSKCLKVRSIKKRKDLKEDLNDNTNDMNKSTRKNRNIYTAEEDKMRDELIAKHIQLKCEICDTSVTSYKDLKIHFRTEHNRKSFITCCGKRFTQRFLLVDHINSHLNPDHFKCKICGKVFKSRICIGVHMANKHSDRDQMRHCCEICGKRFSHQSLLTTHMLVHTQERNHVCEICKKGFKSIRVLKAHTQHMHYGEKAPYVCETCGKEYRFKLSFERHIAAHQGQSEQREQCPICRQWFSINYLQRHIKRHELEDVDCEKCGKTFKSKAALSSHMEYSHRSKRIYSCTFCDKTFERALNLKEHIDMHTGNKDYNCAHCPREFRSKANMYAHVKKMHYEQWAQAQCIRNQGPNGATRINNENKNIVAS